jgi:hypothetical protein
LKGNHPFSTRPPAILHPHQNLQLRAMINNTSAFHFAPGCKGNHFVRKLRCVEAGPVIREYIEGSPQRGRSRQTGHGAPRLGGYLLPPGIFRSFEQGERYRSGTDSEWIGHCGDKFKFILKWLKDAAFKEFDLLIPAYGHGQAMVYPDLPYLIWRYAYDYSDEFSMFSRSSGTIDNRLRFKRAFLKHFKNLAVYLRDHDQYRENEADLIASHALFEALLIKKMDGGRIRNWQKVLVDQKTFWPRTITMSLNMTKNDG